MAYSLSQIAASYDRPITTTRRHIKDFEKKGDFKKTSPGKFFNQDELQKLESLLKFKFKPMP